MTPAAQSKEIISFGPFSLIASERLLTKIGVPVELSGRAYDILTTLLSRPNQVISKSDLLARVWSNIIVEEGSLRFHIANLRKALGDGKDGARYITTESGRGYCFVAPISRGEQKELRQVTEPEFRHANLPGRVTGMIGREDDLEKLSARLDSRRFVTVVGAGGVGKTTLAIALGHRLTEAFAGRVLFVDLSIVSDSRLVSTVLSSMLGLSVQSEDAIPNLVAYLRDKRILLILDTCEHLVEAVATLVSTIYTAAPQVHILATSRETLQVDGEHVYRLEPLACPPDDAALTAAAARRFPAVQLFLERALASGAQLDFTDSDAAIVVAICRKLDGVALAIELAARRVEAYGVQQTAALLDKRLTLLWVGPRTAPARQKTLQATLDWSYGLLSAIERTVLRRLAVFVGHFTLDAALAVVASPEVDQSTVFATIDSLVAKSMVATRPIGAMMRYRLLDTTRAYALGIGIDTAEAADLAIRHATYFRQWLEHSGSDWSSLSTGVQRTEHFANLNNVRAALEWCFGANGNAKMGVALAAAAAPVFLAMSLLPECRRWSEQALLALDDEARATPEEMHLQTGLGFSSMFTMGNSEHSHAALMRGLELAEKYLDPANQLRLIGQIHMFHRRAGNFDRMLTFARRSETIANALGDPIGTAVADVLLGVSHHLIGDQLAARTHIETAIARGVGADPAKAQRFGFNYQRLGIVLARILWLLGYPDQAVRLARESVSALTTADPISVSIALIWGASVFRWVGDLASAKECIDRLITHANRHSLTPHQAVGHGLNGEVLIQQGEIEPGTALLRRSLVTLHAEQYQLYATEFTSALAQGLAMTNCDDEALQTIDKAIAQATPHGELSMPELLRLRGELLEKISDEPAAEAAYFRAIELADQQSALSWRLRASTSLARLQLRQGRRKEARKGLAETYARFTEGFETADLKSAHDLLATLK
jgi:predicted ATPase/DNA-binding winged helix-turn-helix (wHTH) protein